MFVGACKTRRRVASTLPTCDRLVNTSLGCCKGGSCGSAWLESFWLEKNKFFILQVMDALYVRRCLEKLAAALHRPSQPVIAW